MSEDKGLVGFSKRVGIIASAFVACAAAAALLMGWATADLKAADKRANDRIDQLAKVVELAAVVMIEPDSTLRVEALAELRRMRRVTQ